MSTINTSYRSQAATPTQESSTLSPTEAKSAWQNVLNQSLDSDAKLKGRTIYLGEQRIERYTQKVSADMEKFIQENPTATAEQIAQHASDRISKHKGYETVSKMTDDYFMSRMMSRAKELMADLWE
jgi:hypothetical protein